jgi:alpha-beta hydrolase superfamily lysophospholipase
MWSFFNDCGFDVRSHDHRGHGRSGGARGDVPDDEAIMRDAAQVFADLRAWLQRQGLVPEPSSQSA